jgi:predicted small secreted protein
MRFFTLVFTLLATIMLTGCQNTATGLTKDFSRNTAEVRKAINEN